MARLGNGSPEDLAGLEMPTAQAREPALGRDAWEKAWARETRGEKPGWPPRAAGRARPLCTTGAGTSADAGAGEQTPLKQQTAAPRRLPGAPSRAAGRWSSREPGGRGAAGPARTHGRWPSPEPAAAGSPGGRRGNEKGTGGGSPRGAGAQRRGRATGSPAAISGPRWQADSARPAGAAKPGGPGQRRSPPPPGGARPTRKARACFLPSLPARWEQGIMTKPQSLKLSIMIKAHSKEKIFQFAPGNGQIIS